MRDRLIASVLLMVASAAAAGLFGWAYASAFPIEHPGFALVWWTPLAFASIGLMASMVVCLLWAAVSE